MICLHSKATKKASENIIAYLGAHIIKPRITRELMGAYHFSFSYPRQASHADDLALDMLVSTVTEPDQSPQLFRITSLDYDQTDVVQVGCDHIFFDLKYAIVPDVNIVNSTSEPAVRRVLAASGARDFRYVGPTGKSASARVVRQNLASWLIDKKLDNGFARRWNVEIIRDNFAIRAHSRVGSDKGVSFETGKNITAIRQTLDLSGVITRILPVGFDGLTLPELYVTSEKANKYAFVRTAVMRFDSVKAIKPEDKNPTKDALPYEEALAKLREIASAQFVEGLDEPEASWDIDVVSLKHDPLYQARGYSAIHELSLGDTVTIKAPELSLRIAARPCSI